MNDDNKPNKPKWVRPHSPHAANKSHEEGRGPNGQPQLSAGQNTAPRETALRETGPHETGPHESGYDITHSSNHDDVRASQLTGERNFAAGRRSDLGTSRSERQGIADGCYHGVSYIGHYGVLVFERFVGLFFKRREGRGRFINYGAGAALILAVALSVFYYSMGWRALSVSFLKPQIEAALADSFGGADVRIDNVLLQRDRELGGLFLRLTNMTIRSQQQEPIAASPETAIGLKFFPLLIGSVEPDSLSLIGPEVHLVRDQNGEWSLWGDPSGMLERRSEGALTDSGLADATIAELGDAGSRPVSQLGDAVEGALAKVHSRLQKSINLADIGVLKARVVLHASQKDKGDIWYIPSFAIQYDPSGEKQLVGRGIIQHEQSPGAGMWVSIRHREGEKFVDVKTQLENIVPSELSSLVPVLQSLKPVHVGVSGDMEARIHLVEGLLSGKVKVSLAEGHIGLLSKEGPSFEITRGAFDFTMKGDAKHIVMERGDLFYPNGHISLKGDIWRDATGAGPKDWRFQLYSTEGSLVSQVAGMRYPIREFNFSGQLFKVDAPISIDELRVQIGDSNLIMAHDGSSGYPAILRGRVSNVPLDLVKTIWPKGYRQDSRDWVFDEARRGVIKNGEFALEGFSFSENQPAREADDKSLKLPAIVLEIADPAFTVFDNPLLVEGKAAVVRISGSQLTTTMDEGGANLGKGKKVTFKEGILSIADYEPKIPDGVISLKLESDAASLLALLKRDPFEHHSLMSEKAENIEGKVSGDLTISTPLSDEVNQEDVRVEGKLVLLNGKADVGKFNFNDGAINFLLGPNYIEAKGTTLINGVSADLEWRRQIVTKAGYVPPPLLIRGVYDEADRNQLGLDVNHLVQGPMPMEVVFRESQNDKFDMSVSADLTKAVLKSSALGWRKEAGVSASLDFKIVPGDDDVVLEDFEIKGQDLTAKGRIVLDDQSEVRSFYFPKISYQIVSNITLKGERGDDDIWNVMATGATYDGRGVLKSLLRTGQVGDGGKDKAVGGLNLISKFDTVIGWQQSKLSDFQINMKRRGDKMISFAVDGRLRNGGLLKARQVSSGGQDPIIQVETSDAGEALRFVGFYPNMLGGTGELTVRYNVKKRQLASKTGELVITRFSIASDPVVREVLSNIASGKKNKTVAGQDIIPFNRLVAPFSIGHEQFVLHESYVSGELLGATMRGSIDFQKERVRLGGTYIPLYGLNAAVGAVPVLGDILVGRRGEGMLGITFGIYGNINKPEVLVNPMSLVAPGVFRQIFEFEQGKQQIRARPDSKPNEKIKRDSSASKPQRKSQLNKKSKTPETSASTVIRRSAN